MFGAKIKILKFGTIFGLEVENYIVIFEISTLEFVCLQNLVKKCQNVGPRMPYLGIFGLEFQKAIVIFEINTFEFV